LILPVAFIQLSNEKPAYLAGFFIFFDFICVFGGGLYRAIFPNASSNPVLVASERAGGFDKAIKLRWCRLRLA
jgi:hypothetical protein